MFPQSLIGPRGHRTSQHCTRRRPTQKPSKNCVVLFHLSRKIGGFLKTEVFWDVTRYFISHGRFGWRRFRDYLPWRWRNYAPLKHQGLFTSRHNAMSYLSRLAWPSTSPRRGSFKYPPTHFPKISTNDSALITAKHASTGLWQNLYLITTCWLDVRKRRVCVTSDVWRKCADRLPQCNHGLQRKYLSDKAGRTGMAVYSIIIIIIVVVVEQELILVETTTLLETAFEGIFMCYVLTRA